MIFALLAIRWVLSLNVIPRCVARGKYLVGKVAACTACHGADLGGQIVEDNFAFGRLVSANLTRLEAAAGRPIFTTGHVQRYRIAASGGTPTTRYYIGGAFNRDEGIEPTNYQRRFSGRTNITVTPNQTFELGPGGVEVVHFGATGAA